MFILHHGVQGAEEPREVRLECINRFANELSVGPKPRQPRELLFIEGHFVQQQPCEIEAGFRATHPRLLREHRRLVFKQFIDGHQIFEGGQGRRVVASPNGQQRSGTEIGAMTFDSFEHGPARIVLVSQRP
jgi:hypothetical protein